MFSTTFRNHIDRNICHGYQFYYIVCSNSNFFYNFSGCGLYWRFRIFPAACNKLPPVII